MLTRSQKREKEKQEKEEKNNETKVVEEEEKEQEEEEEEEEESDYLLNIKNNIRNKWISGKHPISFTGINNIKKYFPEVPVSIIKDALAGIDTYTLFRSEKKPRYRNPYYVWNKRAEFQMDLIDWQKYAKFNDGVNYLLCVIDIFSRYAWVIPIKNKNEHTVLSAFKTVINRLKHLPKQIESDHGTEFRNKSMTKYLKSLGIKHKTPNDHASYVERFIKTIKTYIRRYMEEYQTFTYIDALENILSLYNNKIHSTIKMSPSDAEKDKNHSKVANVLDKYYKKATGNKKHKANLKIGDEVRISAYKSKFHKGYELNFKPDIYIIHEVKHKMPVPMYVLRKKEDNTIEAGTWYEHELQPISKDVRGSLFKIEKIIKTRGKGNNKEALVKWLYYPETENSWEPMSKIKEINQKHA